MRGKEPYLLKSSLFCLVSDLFLFCRANGRLAEEYATLIGQMWSDRFRAVAPAAFKSAMGSFRGKFYDHEQQDTHEFLTDLLGTLSLVASVKFCS